MSTKKRAWVKRLKLEIKSIHYIPDHPGDILVSGNGIVVVTVVTLTVSSRGAPPKQLGLPQTLIVFDVVCTNVFGAFFKILTACLLFKYMLHLSRIVFCEL